MTALVLTTPMFLKGHFHHFVPALLALLLAAIPDGAAARQSEKPTPAAEAPTQVPAEVAAFEHYRVGPGDLLSVRAFEIPDLSHTARVSNSGRIHVPYIGVINVHDMTLGQIRDELTRRLRAEDLVRTPWIDVRVAEQRARPVYVLGEVMNPGQYIIKNQMRVLDLVTMANGLNNLRSPVGYLYRRRSAGEAGEPAAVQGQPDASEPSTDEAIKIDLRGLVDGTNLQQNIQLQAGDVLYVPEPILQRFFVTGDVGAPGVFDLSTEQPRFLTQAIFGAGGPTKTSRTSKVQLMRFKQGTREEVTVDLNALLQGQKPDIQLQADDIIFVPGSAAKSVGYSLLGLVPSILMRGFIW